jgi:hypothetical protein
MTETLRDVQIPFLASMLLLACVAKLAVRDGYASPVATLYRRRPIVLGVACAEGILGIALLVTPLGIVRLANIVFFATATSVVGDLTRRGSGEGCGCFGGLSTTPAGRRSVVRVALLTVAAIASAGSRRTGLQILGSAGAWSVLLLAAETTLLLALSPELIVAIERTRRSVPCELRDVPVSETYATLHASAAWQAHKDGLASPEPAEVWRELCDRYVVYAGTAAGRPAAVVFAVPIGGRPSAVRAAVVEAAGGQRDDGTGPQHVASPA